MERCDGCIKNQQQIDQLKSAITELNAQQNTILGLFKDCQMVDKTMFESMKLANNAITDLLDSMVKLSRAVGISKGLK